jgi:hydroxymethylglutaryl-CoA lyase/(R)-citramalyl-CoA lyase
VTRVVLCDVAARDGLQNDPKILEPATRAELVNRLAAAGVKRIEAVSFVNPSRVPQMAGAEEVVAAIERREGVVYAGLALNDRGYDRLRDTGLDEVHFAFAVSEEFNRRNSGAEVEDSVQSGMRMLEAARRDGIRATVTLGTSFGCPFEGAIDPGRVLELAARFASAGADEIVFADTVGVAVPRQVREIVTAAVAAHAVPIGVHLHNTRNTGFANALTAVEAGATVLDASVGGIGGCPFAPRATGNISTEDLVYLLNGEGVETGVDLDALIEVSEWLEGVLGRELEGMVYRAGAFAPVSG